MTQRAKWFSLLVLAPLSACAINYYYSPGVYPIADERIRPFSVDGPVEIVNTQAIADRKNVIARFTGAIWMGDLQRITQALIDQLSGEIVKRGGQVSSPSQKRVRIAVTNVTVEQGAWTLKVSLTLTVQLADRPPRVVAVENRSPGNIWRAVNGSIALAVIKLLGDPEVLQFFAASQETRQGTGMGRVNIRM